MVQFYSFLMCIGVLCLDAYLCEDVRSCGAGVTDSSCEVLCGCRDLNQNPLEEHSVLSIPELSLHQF